MRHEEFERKAFDGLKLYFQCWETDVPQKGIVCLVHGLGEHSGRYTDWATRLNQAGYTFLTYDLRGHGKSGGQRGHILSYDEYLSDTDMLVKEAQQRYQGIPCFLYGHSLGAIIVWIYVLRYKPKLNGVILSALDYRNALEEQKLKVLMAKVLGSVAPKMSIYSGLDPQTISRDPQIVSAYINDPLVHNQLSLGFAKSSMDVIRWANQHTSEWNLPVLVMHGELDKLGYVIGSKEFASKVKGDCTLKIWQGLYHEVHNEPKKEQVFEFLREWLDAHIVMP
jgi:alpha-beta hydrolase superfamily lysophospholipase